MRALLINSRTKAEATQLSNHACLNPLPMDNVKIVGDNPKHVMHIQQGYRIVFSLERQVNGLARHVSISVEKPGAVPSPYATQMIMELLGFKQELQDCIIAIEPFAPGHDAVNVVEFIDKEIHTKYFKQHKNS